MSTGHFLWTKPQHHEDVANKSDHVGWIELFYDLVHVVCVFLLGDFLSHHLGIGGFFAFVGLFALIWMAWGDTIYYTSLYISSDVGHRILMALQIGAIMIFAAAIPSIAEEGARYFALGYAANRAILAYMYYRAVPHDRQSSLLAREMSRLFAVIAVIFLVSAFLPAPWNYVLWAIAVIMLQLGYLHPTRGTMRHQRFVPRQAHLSERFALLMLIVIGEGFFKMVVTLSEIGPDKLDLLVLMFNFVSGAFGLFLMAWVYFDFVGNGITHSTDRKTMAYWWYGHLVAMLSAIMVGVALKALVKVGFFEPYPFKYAVVGCLGLALFLLSSWFIQLSIRPRSNHDHYGVGLRLFGVILALVIIAIVQFVPSIVGNTLFMIALASQVAVPFYRSRRQAVATT